MWLEEVWVVDEFIFLQFGSGSSSGHLLMNIFAGRVQVIY